MKAEDVVRGLFKAWEEDGLVAGYDRFIHPDVVYLNTGLPDQHGKQTVVDGIRTYVEQGDMPFVKVDIKTLMSQGNVVVAERVDTMFSRENDKTHALPAMGTFIIEDGLIKEYRDYFDPTDVLATFEGKF